LTTIHRDNRRLAADPRLVLTLDAGGTSFRFNAVRGGRALLPPLRLPSLGHDLDACLGQLLSGFDSVHQATGREAVALSLAFPGPTDYGSGVAGDLPNLTAFRGGVAVGPMLESHFCLPTFLNNDAALFTYGESLAGLLPWVNDRLAASGSRRRFHNLHGFTFGTGFGGGLVLDGRLVRGDNFAAGQIWSFRHRDQRHLFAEEGVSIRAVRRVYAELAGVALEEAPEPRIIAEVATGRAPGHAQAAREAFRRLGQVAGDVIAQVLSWTDGLVVLGGGLSAATALFLPALLDELNGRLEWVGGTSERRLAAQVLNLEDPNGVEELLRDRPKTIPIWGTDRTVGHDPNRRTAIGVTRLGTTEAVFLGAYAFALAELDDPISQTSDLSS
jgi:glucokinase